MIEIQSRKLSISVVCSYVNSVPSSCTSLAARDAKNLIMCQTNKNETK